MNPMGFVIMIVGLMLVWIGYSGNQSAIFAVISGKAPAVKSGGTYNPATVIPGIITNLFNATTVTPTAPQAV
jgi:hypothetical protein